MGLLLAETVVENAMFTTEEVVLIPMTRFHKALWRIAAALTAARSWEWSTATAVYHNTYGGVGACDLRAE